MLVAARCTFCGGSFDLYALSPHQLRDEMVRLKAIAEEARAQVGAEGDARMELQQRHEAMVGQWRSALEQREREMEDLQERLNPPRDLDLLRAQIAEEMSASHAAHVAALQAEADGFRTSLFEMQVGATAGCARCCMTHQAFSWCVEELRERPRGARVVHAGPGARG